jgi:3-dehydroquinate dehydratase-1
MIQDFDEQFVKQIINNLGNRLIILFHRGTLKDSRINAKKKLRILDVLHNTNVFLDLDITEKKEIEYLQKQKINVKTIISYHNYQKTPDKFSTIVDKMQKLQPTIYKISTKCNSENDALRLLQLLLEFRKQKKQYVVLGMGKFGTITRVFGTLWGNAVIYAPQKQKEASAPGQLTKHKLKNIFYELKELDPSP